MIKWKDLKVEDKKTIYKIADRVMEQGGLPLSSKMDVIMDIEAGHLAIPLDLDKLLNAPAGDFGHDIGGIRRHLNRTTGKLENCFLPRCAKPEDGRIAKEEQDRLNDIQA